MSDTERQLTVEKSPLGKDDLLPRRIQVYEHLSQPFVIELELLSEDPNIKLSKLLGKNITVSLLTKDNKKRYFDGVVSAFSHTGQIETQGARLSSYRATLRPWLWLLTRTSNCRIFQEKKVKEIVQEVLKKHSFAEIDYNKLKGTYETREYCVQYRETDFDFLHRLMEEEGIYYYCEHKNDKHTIVLCDSVSAHDPGTGYATLRYIASGGRAIHGQEDLFHWSVTQHVRSGGFALNAFDFEKPTTKLLATTNKALEHEHSKLEVYEYPGRYVEKKVGERFTKQRLEALQADSERTVAQTYARGMAAGNTFTLKEYPRTDQNGKYLIVSTELDMAEPTYRANAPSEGVDYEKPFSCTFESIDSDTPFRPPLITPRGLVMGPQTAVVVGKKGEEIWTDKHGRIKVQFHWDREGKKDENSSCWIRTAQVWAGRGWGGVFIPRIGQEVIVDFLEGDPDRPIITGRVYNGEQKLPYELPKNANKSGIQSRSTKKGDKSAFNELRFDDTKDKEEVYFHAERDFKRVVENNDVLQVGQSKKDKGDQKIDIYNDQTITIEKGEQKTTVKTGNQTTTIEKGDRIIAVDSGDQKITIKSGNRTTKIKGNDNVTISTGNQLVKISAGKHTTQAGQAIVLKVGGNSIKIDNTGVVIKGLSVKVHGNVKVDIKAPMTSVKGMAMLALKGGITMIN